MDKEFSKTVSELCSSIKAMQAEIQMLHQVPKLRGLDGKTGSEGCLGPHTSRSQVSYHFSVEREVLQVQMPTPFGLSSMPRVFTKVLKPIVGFLRQVGCRLIIYLDDILIIYHNRDQLHATDGSPHLLAVRELGLVDPTRNSY